MPTAQIKNLAKKAGKSDKEAEKLWRRSVKIAEDEFGVKQKDFSNKQYAYTTGVYKQMIGKKKESVLKEQKLTLFYDFSEKEYSEAIGSSAERKMTVGWNRADRQADKMLKSAGLLNKVYYQDEYASTRTDLPLEKRDTFIAKGAWWIRSWLGFSSSSSVNSPWWLKLYYDNEGNITGQKAGSMYDRKPKDVSMPIVKELNESALKEDRRYSPEFQKALNNPRDTQSSAAQTLGNNTAINPETIYNWSKKHNVDLVMDGYKFMRDLKGFAMTVLNDEPLDESTKRIKEMNDVKLFNIQDRDYNDPVAMTDLEMFIQNDGDLYRQRVEPMIKNLRRKVMNGTYDHEKAPKLWMYLIDEGAKKYARDFGNAKEWMNMFPKKDRMVLAKAFADHYYEEITYDMNESVKPKSLTEAQIKDLGKDFLSNVSTKNFLEETYLKIHDENSGEKV